MSCQVAALVVMCGHPDDRPAAHRTDLDLEEPSAEARLMKHVLAIRDLHDLLAGCLIEGLQADAAVEVLGLLGVEVVLQEHVHVGLHDFLSLHLIDVLVGLVVGSVPVLVDDVAEDGQAKEGDYDREENRQAQEQVGLQLVLELQREGLQQGLIGD